MPSKFKLGRQPRSFNPAVPHLSALKQMFRPAPVRIPNNVENMQGFPPDLGVMLNDRLGDCTCAALGHAEQIWTKDAQKVMVTVPDRCIADAYEKACGWNGADVGFGTDAGGNEQTVLTWWMKTGLLQADGSRRKILGFVEVDPRNIHDICEAIYECGLVYIGFEVPANIPETAGSLWSGRTDLGPIEGGHAVVVPGYNDPMNPIFDVESWGMDFKMDLLFWRKYVDECYAPISPLWIQANGKSPWGLTEATIEAQMAALRGH